MNDLRTSLDVLRAYGSQRLNEAADVFEAALDNAVAYLRMRAEQRPSDGLIARQGLNERAIEYGQALLKSCADELETLLTKENG